MKPLFFTDDAQFWFETLRTFGHITYGGADFGEVAVTAQRITAGDYDSWHDEWLLTADRVVAQGRDSLAGGHRVSARDAFLRASNYYRNADFFLHGNPADPRILSAYTASVDCFRTAAVLHTPVLEPVEIPYRDVVLPGYLYRADASGDRRPTVVMFNGFDGSAEEMHFFGAAAAVERGYTVLTFDGPGQPGTRHRHDLPFRPDWENVVGPVVDYALTLPEVDPDRIALFGNSMGGLLAPRAAAFDHRIAALIAVDGVYDLSLDIASFVPGDAEEVERRVRADHDPELDEALEAAMKIDPTVRWAIQQGMYVMGAPTPRAFAAFYLDYHLRNGIAERIKCPTLVCSGVDDEFFRGQPELLYEHLTCPKTLLQFTADQGASAHCRAGAQRLSYARVFDWLDDVLKDQRSASKQFAASGK